MSKIKLRKQKPHTKFEQYNSYCEIYQAEFNGIGSVNKNCQELNVSKHNYCRWKKKNGLLTSKAIKTKSFACILPTFTTKIHPHAFEAIEDYYEKFTLATGAEIIRHWIWTTYKIRVSNQTIRAFQKQYPKEFIGLNRKKLNKLSGEERSNTPSDLIQDNYTTTDIRQKIGVDGTWIKLEIAGKLTKFLCEIAYDWHNLTVIGWAMSHSENTAVVSEVLEKVNDYLKVNKKRDAILQMDRGTANTSYHVVELEKKSNFIISMSEAGFKHNSPTESMNGWIKDRFYKTYGNCFKSIQEFIKTFALFIEQINNFQTSFFAFKKAQKLSHLL